MKLRTLIIWCVVALGLLALPYVVVMILAIIAMAKYG